VTTGPDSDPYQVLGVATDASIVEIRAAWRRVVKTSHPDVGGDPAAFRELQQAFELLGDAGRRATHDRQRRPSNRVGDPGVGRGNDVASRSGSASASGIRPDQQSAATAADLRSRWIGTTTVWELPGAASLVSGTAAVMSGGGSVLAMGYPPDGSPSLVAIDPLTGARQWSARFATPIDTAVAPADLVVVSTADAVIHGLAADTGVTAWERPLSAPARCMTSLAIHRNSPDGTAALVAVAAGDGVMAIDAAGSVRWAARLGHDPVWLMSTSTALVVATAGNTVVALDPRTGRTRWWVRHRVNPAIEAVEAAGIMWLADGGQRLVGLDPSTGAATRVVDVGEAIAGVHRVGGRLAVRTGSAALVLLGATGSPRWKVHFAATFSAPAHADGAVVVAVADGSLRMLSERTGAELHHVVVDLGGITVPRDVRVDGDVVMISGLAGQAVGLQRIG
jgi:outer membrane protein assembly factor BamB